MILTDFAFAAFMPIALRSLIMVWGAVLTSAAQMQLSKCCSSTIDSVPINAVEDGLVHVDIALPDYKLALFLENAHKQQGKQSAGSSSLSDGTALNG